MMPMLSKIITKSKLQKSTRSSTNSESSHSRGVIIDILTIQIEYSHNLVIDLKGEDINEIEIVES